MTIYRAPSRGKKNDRLAHNWVWVCYKLYCVADDHFIPMLLIIYTCNKVCGEWLLGH